MAPIHFIAVPVGTAGGPEWRGVIARYGEAIGFKIFWCACVLAELAAKADRGGLLAYANGQPKSALEICAELGVEAVWAAETLFPALERLGEGHWQEDGAWVCTSLMIRRTLEWREDQAAKALPAPQKRQERPRTLVLDGDPPGGETKAAREKRLGRNRKRTADYRAKWGCDPDHIVYSVAPSVTQCDDSVTVPLLEDGNAGVTVPPQVADSVDKIPALPLDNIKDVKVTNTSSYVGSNDDDDDETAIDIRPALVDVPATQRPKVGDAVKKALRTGHALHTAHQAIDDARREATPGRPWVNLALYKLGELSKPESLPAKPKKPTCNPVESVPVTDPAADEEFEKAMANPCTPLYKAMYARITDFAREMGAKWGEGDAAFVGGMREAFDALMLQPQGSASSTW